MDHIPTPQNRPEQLIAAVLHLMSHYTTSAILNRDQGVCVRLAAVIERHLMILSGLPDLGPVLRATCSQLSEQWTTVIEHSMPRPQPTGLLARWRTSLPPTGDQS